ncbi:MAG TPA: hypothetical protein DD490_28400 [Acidobacteria bacterium]|nr:hypothetical protein [Acidobacteriota bacterium]
MSRCKTLTASLALALSSLFVLTPASQAAIRTVVVSPVPGNPVASCNDLKAALAAIPSPSSTDRWLLKVEPGTYDCQDTYVQMREWVDIEGSGEGQTLITSYGPGPTAYLKPTVLGANNAELRELTIGATPNPTPADGIQMGIFLAETSTSLRRLSVNIDAGVNCDGISIRGGSPVVTDVKVRTVCSNYNYGIINWATLGGPVGSPAIERVSVLARNATNNHGIAIRDGMVPSVLQDLRVEASNGTANYGLHIDLTTSATLVVGESLIEAKTGSGTKYGIYLKGGLVSLHLEHSQVKTAGAGTKTGIWAQGEHTVEVRSSIVTGSANTLGGTGTFKVGASHLNGGAVAAPATCAGVYDENYTFYAATCP